MGYIYHVNDGGAYTDSAASITMDFVSRHEPNVGQDVRVMKTELELTDPDNVVSLTLLDTIGQVGNTVQLAPVQSGAYFGEVYFGEAYFAGGDALVRRQAEFYDQYAMGRMLATSLTYTSSTDRIEIQKCEHLVKQINQSFQVRV